MLFKKIRKHAFFSSEVSSADTFTNNLDPDQAQYNIGPALDPNCLTLMSFMKQFKKKMIIDKISRWQNTLKDASIH